MDSKNYNETVIDVSEEDSKGKEEKAPSFQELSDSFDKQLEVAFKFASTLSKNSLLRVFKKSLAWPLKHDEIPLFQKDETLPYEISTHVQQIKTNMTLEQIRQMHLEEAEKVKRAHTEEVKNG